MRKWNTKGVLKFVQREEIRDTLVEKCRDEGDPEASFKYYQKVVSKFMKSLDPDTRKGFKRMAAEWNDEGLPEAVHQRAAEQRVVASIIRFQKLIYEKMGVYMVSMFGYQGSNGKARFYCIDTPGTDFLKTHTEWDQDPKITGTFSDWLKKQLDKDPADVGAELKFGHNKKVKEDFTLEVQDNGYPILPQILPTMKALGETGEKLGVPWNQVMQQPTLWIDPKWLPEGTFNDPSHMLRMYSNAMLVRFHDQKPEDRFFFIRTARTLKEARICKGDMVFPIATACKGGRNAGAQLNPVVAQNKAVQAVPGSKAPKGRVPKPAPMKEKAPTKGNPNISIKMRGSKRKQLHEYESSSDESDVVGRENPWDHDSLGGEDSEPELDNANSGGCPSDIASSTIASLTLGRPKPKPAYGRQATYEGLEKSWGFISSSNVNQPNVGTPVVTNDQPSLEGPGDLPIASPQSFIAPPHTPDRPRIPAHNSPIEGDNQPVWLPSDEDFDPPPEYEVEKEPKAPFSFGNGQIASSFVFTSKQMVASNMDSFKVPALSKVQLINQAPEAGMSRAPSLPKRWAASAVAQPGLGSELIAQYTSSFNLLWLGMGPPTKKQRLHTGLQ
ncbi:hypothetical protein JAAARDRAFT_189951 [Jaapia argillacea MUCL 33604]|uniref:Uncharacterized protein n=1 Tax=Jaapia argillacea MUCL 33604 TaxID=933084 RepID=A0A067Q6I0_9AGAM|nr:hypothetical protein JAAARDRAFT_189951 [Jaapia argillacea MUCL 33604]